MSKCPFTDEELFLLWSYWLEKGLSLSPYLRASDLSIPEKAFIIRKIFGKDMAENYLKDNNFSSNYKFEPTSRRNAVDIVRTYKRRGYHFLRNTIKEKQQIPLEEEYLDANNYGFLNEKGCKKVKEIFVRHPELLNTEGGREMNG